MSTQHNIEFYKFLLKNKLIIDKKNYSNYIIFLKFYTIYLFLRVLSNTFYNLNEELRKKFQILYIFFVIKVL